MALLIPGAGIVDATGTLLVPGAGLVTAAAGVAVPVFLYHYRTLEDSEMQYLREDTADQTILLGPFIDDTDGKTAETGLTIANTDIKIVKHSATTASDKNSGGATHIASGYYYTTLDATDTSTVGRLDVYVSASGALPVRKTFWVLEEAIYDALFAASAAAFDANADVTVGAIANNAITADAIAAGAIDAATFAADVDAEAAAWIWNAATGSFGGAGTYGQAVEDVLADTGTDGVVVASIAANAVTAAALAADAGSEIGTAVWATAARTLTAATNITSTGGAVPITGDGNVEADVKAINAVEVDGAGTSGDPWGPV